VAATVGGAIEGAGTVFGTELGDREADAAAAQGRPVAASGVPLISHQATGAAAGSATSEAADGAVVEQRLQHGGLVLLTRCEQDGQRFALALGLEVHLGREAALTAPQRFGCWSPPFAPAACWWARITLLSINWTSQSTAPAASSSCWTAANTRSQLPATRHRQKRLYTVDHGPYRSGRSRQGAPVRSRQRMPLMICRWSLFVRPVSGFSGGSSGSSRSHSESVSSPRCLMPMVEQIPAHPSGHFAYRL